MTTLPVIEKSIPAQSPVGFDEKLAQHDLELKAAGVDVLQLRDKNLGDRELLARARLARELTRSTATLLIVNDRPDIAALSQADGVHVGQEELSVKDARTKYQQGNFHNVMDGDIQGFFDAVLRWRAGQPVADDDE